MRRIFIAQKGLVLDRSKTKILVIKYSHSDYLPKKINGKLGLPGGQMDFGEKPDASFIREVKEETGITITPSLPFYIWSWKYKKENTYKQIVAVARLAYYKSGKIYKHGKQENESKIKEVKWIKIIDLKINDFIEDEQPVIKGFLKYAKQNPFK